MNLQKAIKTKDTYSKKVIGKILSKDVNVPVNDIKIEYLGEDKYDLRVSFAHPTPMARQTIFYKTLKSFMENNEINSDPEDLS